MHGPKLAKIANKKFNAWLKWRGLEVLGREKAASVQSGGWPDFVVKNRKGKIEFFEVKSGNHRLDPHQKEILKLIKKLGKIHVMRLNKKRTKFLEETPPELK